MNYEKKYLKYKTKYNNLKKQLGGQKIEFFVPNTLPNTQSWFIMPFILKPFNNIDVQFDESIEILLNSQHEDFGITTSLNQMLLEYYNKNNINLDDILNLQLFGSFDSYLHLPGNVQEQILEDSYTDLGIYAIIQELVFNSKYHNIKISMVPIINYKTDSVKIYNGETNNLTNLDVNCRNNMIQQFKLNYIPEPEYQINYNYKCYDNYNGNEYIYNDTHLDEYGYGYNIYLDRHYVNCGDNEALVQFKLNKLNDKINYSYKCKNVNLNNIVHYNTELNDNGFNNVIFLDRHNIECPKDKVLKSFKLNNYSNNNISYNYSCGKPNI